MQSISILGVKVHKLTLQDALDEIQGYVASDRGHIVVTADASGVVTAQKDKEFQEIVNNADLVTPDSVGILLAAKWFGNPLPERVSGVDLVQEVCRIGAEKGWSIFFLGAAPGVSELAAANLGARFRGLKVAGVQHGYFQNDEEVVGLIRESGAQVLFAALGIPKQEKWISVNLDRLGVRVAIGVGGSFDVFSGKVKRAPKWMREHGLEWIHRLAMNPRKIGKVATLPRFVLMALREKMFPRHR